MSQQTERHGPGWPGWTGAAVLLAAAAVLSFTTLADLAERAGYADWRRWLFPIVIDAAFLVAARFWLARGLVASAARMGFWLALAMLLLSILGNALEHWLDTGGVLSPALSTIPPTILGAVGVLVDLAMRGEVTSQPAEPAEPVTPPATAPVAFTVTTRTASRPATVLDLPPVEIAGQPIDHIDQPVSHPDSEPARVLADRLAVVTQIRRRPARTRPASGAWMQHLDRAREVVASQPDIGRPALATALGIPTSQARKLLDHIANQPAATADHNQEETSHAAL